MCVCVCVCVCAGVLEVFLDHFASHLGVASASDHQEGEVGGWGRDPKKCTGRGWGMGSSTI